MRDLLGLAAACAAVLAVCLWLDARGVGCRLPYGPRHLYPGGGGDDWLWRQQALFGPGWRRRDCANGRPAGGVP